MKKRVLSGIRATGSLHLGNYLGAIKGMIKLQNDPAYETLYMVADLHSINTEYDPATFQASVRNVVLDYLAAGLDPQKAVIFVQSHVPEHVELSYLLSPLFTVARMQHLPTYKDKLKESSSNANMGMLYYPILMAADILLYKADAVPVGDDQLPHLEIAREAARKLKDKYKVTFPEPQQFRTDGHLVPSLLGVGKMSKSVEGSSISLIDSLETIKSKLAKIPTDSGQGQSLPKEGGLVSLFSLVELFEGAKKRKEYEDQYTSQGLRYSEIKNQLAKAIYEELKPIQEKRRQLEANPSYVNQVIQDGAIKAQTIAQKTLLEVKEKMGLI